ncbi:MAG TPA: PepSY domain-containing protein [Caulobacteraceae bacterium]|nr:PepSY domain-containing protein [Caulobacteraceae bacterium]
MTGSSLYAAVWRWHFIAGLLVLPVLVMMAITGGAYLFRPELDHLAYRALEDVPARSAPHAPYVEVVRRVEAGLDGRVLQITPPARPDRAVRLLVRGPGGVALTAFADPYDGRLIGSTAYGGIMQLVRKVHSLQKFGFWASCLIEIAAGWAVVLVGTGVFLWWPRGRGPGGVVSVRGAPRQRLFWRDLHAVTGAFAGAVIVFLAVTGMPWSMFWGAHVQRWATAANLYEPPAPAAVASDWEMAATMPNMPHQPHATDPQAKPDMPWAMEMAGTPMSADMPGMALTPISIDQAVAIFRRLGVDPAAAISLPGGPKSAYTATWRPDRVEDTRVIYLDQYSGAVLGDVGFKDWGPAAKAIEWGIAVHQGQEYGPLNRWLMLAGCAAIVLLAISAATMWWKRRPSGALGVPPAPTDPWAVRGLAAIVAVVGVIYPLVGASFLAALAVDRGLALGRRMRPRLA